MADSLASLVWRDDRWLAENGGPQCLASADIAIQYLQGSPFTRDEPARAVSDMMMSAGASQQQLAESASLASQKRSIYKVLHEQPPHLFVIGRFDPSDASASAGSGGAPAPSSAAPACVFYIVDGAVYMAPNLHAVVASRTSRCAQLVSQAWAAL